MIFFIHKGMETFNSSGLKARKNSLKMNASRNTLLVCHKSTFLHFKEMTCCCLLVMTAESFFGNQIKVCAMEPQGPSIVKDQRQRVRLGFLTRLRMGLKQTGLLLVRLQKIYLYLIKQARFLFTMLYDIIQRCYLSFNCPVASKIMVLSIFHGIIFFSFAFGYIVKQDTKFGIDCHKQSLF